MDKQSAIELLCSQEQCYNEQIFEMKKQQVFENQMLISIHDRIGYGSKHDGSMLDLDICPDCFDKLIDGFTEKCAINPMKENY